LNQQKINALLTPLETVACIIAAAGHDVGHLALSNKFLVTTRHPISILYNDVSVLQMMTCSRTFGLLAKEENNFVADLPVEEQVLLRNIVFKLIIATDMERHIEYVSMLRAQISSKKEIFKIEEKLVIYQIAMKCADLGHCAKKLNLHVYWTDKLMDEYYR
jgi:3',5'-cyclic-nucleotide phosphodiesterase